MEEWFNSQMAGFIGGAIGAGLGILGGLIGGFSNFCIRKGWKKIVYGAFVFGIAGSVILLLTGIIALCVKQPYHVWYVFLLPGFIGTIVFSSLFPVMRKRFIEAEIRKSQAQDL